jgi:hypothetical protein
LSARTALRSPELREEAEKNDRSGRSQNRLAAAPPSKRVRTAIGKTIKWLQKQLEEIDSDLDGAVRGSRFAAASDRR